MMKTSTILKRAKKIIAKPEKWIQGTHATNRYGLTVDPDSSSARCFCAAGAVFKVTGMLGASGAMDALGMAATGQQKGFPVAYNDHPNRRHSQILAWFDRAIAWALKQEAA